MEKPQYPIPAEFQSELRFVPSLDGRTDDEILESLEQYAPITSEKNIWAFWDSGVRNMPNWCKRNVTNWIRLCGPSWTVRVIDSVIDSPNYALKYLDADLLPDAFIKATIHGPYVGPHSADFLRGACLYQHGGVFMDVGIILFRDLDRMVWNTLQDPQSPFQIAVPVMYATMIANHFVASRKNDPFIKAWHDLFIYLWRDRSTHEGLLSHPLLAFAQNLSFEESKTAKFHWDFQVPPQTVFEYISQVLSWNRLCMLEDTGRGFSGVSYWMNNVFTFDVLEEDFSAEAEIGFGGPVMFNALSTSLDAPKDSQEYKDAYRAVWRMLSRSSLQKITHGKGLTLTPALGVLWEETQNEGKDDAEGTFARLLRYGSVHFEQTRQSIKALEPEHPKQTLKSTLLEP